MYAPQANGTGRTAFGALASAVRMQLTSTGDAPLTADEIKGVLQRIKLT
jgi:hypothetical protein